MATSKQENKMSGLTIRNRKMNFSNWGLTTALTVALAFGSFAQAHAQQGNPDATINIGSLYEPQNLDNTAGAGQNPVGDQLD